MTTEDGRRLKVLVVDDESDSSGIVERILQRTGAEVRTASPREFGEFIAREIPKWSKVVKESGATVD